MRKRTVKLWRLNEDGRKLFAGTIEAGSPAERAFLATAAGGVYVARYRGTTIGIDAADEAAHLALAA